MPDFSEGNFGHKQFQNVRLLNGQTAFNYKVKVLFFLQVFVGTTSNKCFAFFSGKGGGGFGIVTLCEGPKPGKKLCRRRINENDVPSLKYGSFLCSFVCFWGLSVGKLSAAPLAMMIYVVARALI